MPVKLIAILFSLAMQVLSNTTTVDTTSGRLLGTQTDGVVSFKGIRFAQPPVGNLRWEPPAAFLSSDIQSTITFGPSCTQQFPSPVFEQLVTEPGTPAPTENEDCLFLNVWAPVSLSGSLKPVIVWLYGGYFVLGTASLPMYDGASFAKNQDVVFVSFNYRTNVFGFPTAQDLPASLNNLGLLDQELAFKWVRDNIAQFGGDPGKVTIMGQSAGSISVSYAISRRDSTVVPPFRAGIMLSGVQVSTSPILNFSNFDGFATAMGCTQPPGPLRLQCLRNISASTIRNYTNGPNSGLFTPGVDKFAFNPAGEEKDTHNIGSVTVFDDPLQRIRQGQIAQVPILLGSVEDEGTVFVLGTPNNLSAFLADQIVPGPLESLISPTLVRALYPGLSDPQVMAAVERDMIFRCPAKLWSDAFVSSCAKTVYRYTYGAVFADLEPFPNLGAYHGSDLPIIFGTFNRSTATAAEVELSRSVQTAFANFVKDPKNSPAPNWPAYEPGFVGVAAVPTLAEIAYQGNVSFDDFIQPVQPISKDGPCLVWDALIDFRP